MAYLRNIGTVVRKGRLLTYSSEVGESGRSVMPRNLVRAMYGVSVGYVVLDIAHFYAKAADAVGDKEVEVFSTTLPEKVVLTVDRTLWHGIASFGFPTLAIHSIVKHSKNAMVKAGMRYPHVAAPMLGLASIPFIIHPIDELTDFIMDKTIREFYQSTH